MLPTFVRFSYGFRVIPVILSKSNIVKPIVENCLYTAKWTNQGFKYSYEKKLPFLNRVDSAMNSVRCKSAKNIERHFLNRKVDYNKKYSDNDEEKFEDDNDYDDDENYIRGKGIEIKILSVSTLRIDGLLKLCFNISRRHIEECFYGKKIWINGQLLMKKGINAQIGDEIDIFKEVYEENENFILVKRLEVLNVEKDDDHDDRLLVKIRKTKSLLVENYQNYQSMKK